MAFSPRTLFAALGVVATGLTITGIVLAATDPNPGGIAKDPFVLNGYPPKSADLGVNVSTSSGFNVNANVSVNFNTNSVDAKFVLPLVQSGISVDARLIGSSVYVSTENFSSLFGKPWISVPEKFGSLYGYSLELVKPDIALISGFPSRSVSKVGNFTTYDFVRHDVAVTTLGTKHKGLPKVGTLEWMITTGQQGEVTSSTLTISNKTQQTTISFSVLSYNKKVNVVTPAANQVKPVSAAYVQKLLKPLSSIAILMPENLSNLGSTKLS
jgi:hypothetical protein